MVELKCRIKIDKQKLKAFTMLESVVAITILSVLVALGSATYSTILNSENPFIYHKAMLEIDRCFYELENSRLFEDKNVEYENFSIKQEVKFLKRDERLYHVAFIAYDREAKKIYQEEHLIAK